MNKKKLAGSRIGLVTMAVASLVLSVGCSGGVVGNGGDGGADGDGSVTLEFASFMAEAHPYSQWYLDWADEVTEATEGRVTFDNYFSGSLFNGPDLTAATIDGQVDLSQPNTNYTPDKFPLSEVVSVPYSTMDVAAAIATLSDMYVNYQPYRDEYEKNGLVALQFQPTGTNVLGANKPLPDAAAIDGARVRSASYYATTMEQLGGNPISMPLSDVYQSMQTGLIDAWMTPIENTVQFNLSEVTTHIYDPGMGPTSLSVIIMNKDTFDSLRPEDQEAIVRISDKYNEEFVQLLNEIDQASCEVIAETDIVLETWSQESIEATRAVIGESMNDLYIADAAAAGVDATEFAAKWQEAQDNYDGSYGEYAGSVSTCLGM